MGRIKSPLLHLLLACSFPLFVMANPGWLSLKFQSLINSRSSKFFSKQRWSLFGFSGTLSSREWLSEVYMLNLLPNNVHIRLTIRYYQCDNGFPHELTCPAGLLWNQDLLACDWSSNIECSLGLTINQPLTSGFVKFEAESGSAVRAKSSETKSKIWHFLFVPMWNILLHISSTSCDLSAALHLTFFF